MNNSGLKTLVDRFIGNVSKIYGVDESILRRGEVSQQEILDNCVREIEKLKSKYQDMVDNGETDDEDLVSQFIDDLTTLAVII